MNSFWIVARHEYRRMVFRRAFLFITLAVPLGYALLITMAVVVARAGQNHLPVGYVDAQGLLDPTLQNTLPDPESRVEIREFPDQASARAALEGDEIQAFFVLPADYPANLKVDLYYLDKPLDSTAWGQFDDFVRANLASTLSAPVEERVLHGASLSIQDTSSGRVFSADRIAEVLMPIFATFLFMFATMSVGGYMLQVVADEKENRMMEIMLTSISPSNLIGGKAAGLLGAALTQLAVYLVAAVVAVSIASPYVEALQSLTIPWGYLGIMALFFFPSYGLISAVMIAIGSAVTDLQQIAGVLNLVFIIPIMLLSIMFKDASSPLMIGLTLFPTTAFMTVSLRWGLSSIPFWQLATSWIILVASVAGMIWVAVRVFRIGMLQYGQPLNLKMVVEGIRGG